MGKKIEVPKHPYFPKPLAKSARLVYNQLRNRRILVCPTVAQSETYKALSLLTDYRLDCQHFFRQIFLGYFSDIVQAFDTLRKNVCGDDYTSLHNPIVLSSVLPAYGMFHSIQILFL